jgi:hypothetical protein
MERLFDISVFQYCPFRSKIEFDQNKYGFSPVEHAIEICVSDILDGKEAIMEQDLTSKCIINFNDLYDNEHSLLDKFSATEMRKGTVQRIINERIEFFLRTIKKYDNDVQQGVIDDVVCLPESTGFRAKSGIQGITDVTFNFQITRDRGIGQTTILCTFTSALTIERKIALKLKRAKDLLLLRWKK